MLPLHVGGDLDPRHVPSVDRHLSSCLSCFREFRELSAMRGRMAVLAEQPLPAGILDGFTDEVMARIAVREPGPKAEGPRPGPRLIVLPRLAAAAAVVLVALAGWRLFSDGGHSPTSGGASLNAAPVTTAPVRPAGPRLHMPVLRPGIHDPGSASAASVQAQLIPEGLSVPSGFEQHLRDSGGEPAKIYLLQIGVGSGLEVEQGDRKPRSRDQ
jgi:hypothetical protein